MPLPILLIPKVVGDIFFHVKNCAMSMRKAKTFLF